MNSFAALSKMQWSSLPMVVTDVIVSNEAAGDPPISEIYVDAMDASKPSNL